MKMNDQIISFSQDIQKRVGCSHEPPEHPLDPPLQNMKPGTNFCDFCLKL